MIASKHSRTTARRPRHTILSTLLISFSCWAHLASAKFQCIPTMSFPSGLLPDQIFTLGFKNDEFTPGGYISAFLMCWTDSSTLKDVLVLGGNYAGRQMSPNSPTTSISEEQAKKALAICPNNVECQDTFSLQVAPTSSLPVPSPTNSTLSATSRLVPTGTATGTPSLSASYTLSTPSPSTHPGGNDPTKDDHSTSPSIGLIIGASVGVVALIFVILAVLFVWRKRQQAQARIDYLFSNSLMASSGFQNDKPIYGRSNPDDDHSATHPPAAMDAHMVPMNHDRYGNPRPRPGYTQINQLLPQLPHAAAQHPRYRQQQHQQQLDAGLCHKYDQENCHKYDQENCHKHDQETCHKEEELPPQRQPSYRLPYSQPANDYNYPRGPHAIQ